MTERHDLRELPPIKPFLPEQLHVKNGKYRNTHKPLKHSNTCWSWSYRWPKVAIKAVSQQPRRSHDRASEAFLGDPRFFQERYLRGS